MANHLPLEKQQFVLNLLVEGNSLRGTTRLSGVHRTTIQNLLVRYGVAAQRIMDDRLRSLRLKHVEIDEQWTFVQKKQGRLKAQEKLTRFDIGDQYLWYGVDADTKLVPCHLVGKRSADNARRLLVDLASRLRIPRPHESDPHAFGAGGYRPIVKISTDAFSGYREAIDLAFGPHVEYGQIVKDYRNADQPGRYAPPEMIHADRRGIRGIDNLLTICTSHVERCNLTVRTFVKRFVRLTVAFSKKLENLQAAIALHFAYYNFCWRPRYADDSGKRGQLRPTPAMAAGVVDTLWDMDDLFVALRNYL